MTVESDVTLSNTLPQGIRVGRWGSVVAGLAAVTLLMAGCTTAGSGASGSSLAGSAATGSATGSATTGAASATSVPVTTAPLTATRSIPTGTVNDLKNNSAHHDVALDGESFRLKVDYFTSVDAATWGAIGPKDVHLLAYLNPVAGAKAPDVLVDEFDAQYSLVAANSGLDGLVIARTQDRAGAAIPGFLITAKVSYGTVFPTAGISPELVQRWQDLGGPTPIEEASLQLAGVYAVKASFVYRLLVKDTGDAGWHRRTVLDELTVPVKPIVVKSVSPVPSGSVTATASVISSSTASAPTG